MKVGKQGEIIKPRQKLMNWTIKKTNPQINKDWLPKKKIKEDQYTGREDSKRKRQKESL